VLPEVVAAVIAAGLGIGLGFLALILPGILLALRWSVVAQVAAVDRGGWLPALRRSGELTRGNYWHILGLLVLAGLLAGGLTLAAAALPLGSTSGAASVALGILARTITASFTALALALLYFDLRARSAGITVGPGPGEQPPHDAA
jgi:TRAP-type C4-dicarboxylate transport system permease large subunit